MTDGSDVRAGRDPTTLAAFLALVAVAGGNAVAIRDTSCETCELDPFWGAAMRFLLVSVIFAVIARALHARIPRGRALLCLRASRLDGKRRLLPDGAHPAGYRRALGMAARGADHMVLRGRSS